MTFGSLFSGIGGIDLGLERAGMECKWQVEIDPYCQKVLAKHWPDVRRYEDVRAVGADTLEAVDLIAGGFPCQDVSVAGKREGLKEGNRSGLWFEFHRIICELRPRYVFVENVPGLLANGMGRVLGDLAQGGYDAEWEVLSAADVGAPHLRRRVWIVARNDGKPTGQQILRAEREIPAISARDGREGTVANPNEPRLEGPGAERKVAHGQTATGHPGQSSSTLADTNGSDESSRHESAESPSIGVRRLGVCNQEANWWTIEPDVGRVAHGVPSRVDRLKALGNAVVPQCAEYIGRRIMSHDQE